MRMQSTADRLRCSALAFESIRFNNGSGMLTRTFFTAFFTWLSLDVHFGYPDCNSGHPWMQQRLKIFFWRDNLLREDHA